jgi:CD109 antigen
MKVFCQAKDYISVEDDKMAKTLTWIMNQQNSDGSFNEPGRVLGSYMQGGTSKGVAMSAYVLISLCVNKGNSKINRVKYESAVSNATKFLLSQISSLNSDPYSLSIVIYALKTCGVSGWETPLITLKSKAKTEAGTTRWEQPTIDPAGQQGVAGLNGNTVSFTPSYIQSPSRNIELTSYVLLILASQRNITECVPVCKWLVSQRNSLGGYSSTQDTVMALEALAECALMLMGPIDGSGVNVNVAAGTFNHSFQTISRRNALILQQTEMPQSANSVQITASGKGTALVQCNVKYNVFNVLNNNGIMLSVNT